LQADHRQVRGSKTSDARQTDGSDYSIHRCAEDALLNHATLPNRGTIKGRAHQRPTALEDSDRFWPASEQAWDAAQFAAVTLEGDLEA
jgi:hypothetical protein